MGPLHDLHAPGGRCSARPDPEGRPRVPTRVLRVGRRAPEAGPGPLPRGDQARRPRRQHPAPSSPYATVAVLADAIRAAASRVRATVESDAVGERELAWGEQFDLREIVAFGTDAELTDQSVAAYVAK
ncbi:replication initiator [Streptomyces sp. NPDC002328]|uniref:replication initiator n=1 Tax=Streptomyces sp. NPDC002328 TaxID=3364642 RepID=UPI0036A9836E